MSLALLILCLVIVIQILKIIIKTNIIDKKLVDYNCEYIVLTIAFFATFFRKEIDEHLLMTISIICVIYEIFSVIYAYYNYIKKRKAKQSFNKKHSRFIKYRNTSTKKQ